LQPIHNWMLFKQLQPRRWISEDEDCREAQWWWNSTGYLSRGLCRPERNASALGRSHQSAEELIPS
jgi:hypothetical protein